MTYVTGGDVVAKRSLWRVSIVAGGDVVAKRSLWRVSIVADVFWGVVNFVGVFVTSLFSDPSTIRRDGAARGYGGSSGGGGGAGPRRPMGRIRNQQTINQPMGCGSCCG